MTGCTTTPFSFNQNDMTFAKVLFLENRGLVGVTEKLHDNFHFSEFDLQL